MMKSQPKVILLAVDQLDWTVVQLLMERGLLPTMQGLLARGSARPFTADAETPVASLWTTLLTGVDETMHGILGDLEPGPAGLSARAVSASGLRVPRLWDYLAQSEMRTHVMGWPALMPLQSHPGIAVANGMQTVDAGVNDVWPLAPQSVSPVTWREQVLDHRILADDIPQETLDALLQPLDAVTRKQVEVPSRLLFGQLLSLHSVGLAMAEDAAQPWQLLALRMDTLAAITAIPLHIQLSIHPLEFLSIWYRFLDSMMARYLALLTEHDYFVLVSDRGIDQRLMGRQAHPNGGAGLLLMQGPGIAQDAQLPPASLQDITPSILAMLGLQPHAGLPGHALFEPLAPLRPVTQPEAWPDGPITTWPQPQSMPHQVNAALPEEYAPLWTSLEQIGQRVYEEAWFNLARAEYAQGRLASATEHLRQLFAQSSAVPAATLLKRCVLFCKCLLALGHTAECTALVARYRVAEAGPVWNTTIDGMLAAATEDWEKAVACFSALPPEADVPINIPLWLAESLMALGRLDEATVCLQQATQGGLEQVRAWVSTAKLHGLQQNWSAALMAINHAIAWRPQDDQLLAQRIEIHAALGHTALAKADMLRVLALRPDFFTEAQANALLLKLSYQKSDGIFELLRR